MTGLAGYYFIPTVRRGLSATIKQRAAAERTELQASITVKAEGTTAAEQAFPTTVRLYGPGDVLGFDPGIVTRTDPRPNVGDFEPNYFPLVEFADPDFPWRFTGDVATTSGLMPWIALVVLERAEFDETGFKNGGKSTKDPEVPWIKVLDVAILPNLAHAWRWTHVQVTAGQGLTINPGQLATFETETPDRVVSRLICPRHLKPGTPYSAFVVPTFKLGCVAAKRASALATDTAVTAAWDATATPPPASLELPYYYRWDFHTGLRGDFEYLVRLLEPRKLEDLGLRPMNCADPGFGMGEQAGLLQLEGALQSVGIKYTPWGLDAATPAPEDLQRPLMDLLNKPAIDLQPLVVPVTLPATPPQPVTLLKASVTLAGDGARLDARISWNTPVAASCAVEGDAASAATPLGTTHGVVLPALVPTKPYNVRIRSTPAGGVASYTSVFTLAIPALAKFPLPSVVPPIYGRWYAGRSTVKPQGTAWVDQLNLDPRHRAAAGFGALVVEQQQEALMASAWDQIGQVEDANEVLRRAQLGREAADAIHRRMAALAGDHFLFATRSVQHRLRLPGTMGGGKTTVARYLEGRIPRPLLDPAFRRMQRARGPLGKRLGLSVQAGRPSLLARLNSRAVVAAGPARDPDGMRGLYDVTRVVAKTFNLAVPISSTAIRPLNVAGLTSSPIAPSPGGVATSLRGPVPMVGPLPGSVLPGAPGAPLPSGTPLGATATPIRAMTMPTGQFHPALFSSSSVTAALTEARTLQGVALPAGTDMAEVAGAVSAALDGWLAPVAPPAVVEAPAVNLDAVAGLVKKALNPRATIPLRTKRRLRLADELARRADALEQLVASPEFPHPMYEALRDMSQDLVLPGVERVPQNTLAVLETNGRFVEAYMVALNHSFTGELFWRGAPVSGRSTYFRQFWDVDAVLPTTDEFVRQAEGAGGAATNEPDRAAEVAAQAEVLERAAREPLKDVKPLHLWAATPLGSHDNRADAGQGEQLVLLVRGDLLRKYPNTLVYAVRAVGTVTQRDPGLEEFVKPAAPPSPISPIFSGTLPPDLTFFGFPFTAAEARGGQAKYPLGVYFVLEERVSEARFGMDLADGPAPALGGKPADPEDDWDNLSWAHLPQVVEGMYVDGAAPTGTAGLTPAWNTSSATIASITLQKPVRIAVHADQMLPKDVP